VADEVIVDRVKNAYPAERSRNTTGRYSGWMPVFTHSPQVAAVPLLNMIAVIIATERVDVLPQVLVDLEERCSVPSASATQSTRGELTTMITT